jgi:hypothetical protein
MRVSDWRGSGRPTATPIELDGNPGVVLIGSSIRGGVPQNSRRFSPARGARNAGSVALICAGIFARSGAHHGRPGATGHLPRPRAVALAQDAERRIGRRSALTRPGPRAERRGGPNAPVGRGSHDAVAHRSSDL